MANLKDKALEVFKNNPDVEAVYVTSDGQCFIHKNAAELHKSTNPAKVKKMKISIFKAEELVKEIEVDIDKKDDSKSWQARVKEVKSLGTKEEVELYLKGETSDKVKEAGAERLDELLKDKE